MTPYVWKTSADRLLRTESHTKGGIYVADVLGITPKQVYQRASRLKIRSNGPSGVPFAKGHDERRGPGVKFKKGVKFAKKS